jgi:hypothetical protein
MRSPRKASKPPSGPQLAMIAARCRSQSSKDSISGITGASERRPCLMALRLDAALPRSVFGPRLTIDIRLGRGARKSNAGVTPEMWNNYLTD